MTEQTSLSGTHFLYTFIPLTFHFIMMPVMSQVLSKHFPKLTDRQRLLTKSKPSLARVSCSTVHCRQVRQEFTHRKPDSRAHALNWFLILGEFPNNGTTESMYSVASSCQDHSFILRVECMSFLQ